MKGLTRRAATAAIFVVVMMVGLFVGKMSFILLFAVITTLCLWEYLNLVLVHHTRRDWVRIFIGLAFGLSPFVLASVMHIALADKEKFVIVTSVLFFPLIFMAFIYELFSGSEKPFQNVAFMVLGMVYIGAPFSLLNFIAFSDNAFNVWPIFGLLVLTWMNDTGAYLVGSKLGKTPLLPRISPKKTWEGTIGGVIVTFLVGWLFCVLTGELRLQDWMVLSGIVAVFGSIGDLIESMLKRSLTIKDSGTLLPGHGGVLDRFDAFIFLLPFAAAYLLYIR